MEQSILVAELNSKAKSAAENQQLIDAASVTGDALSNPKQKREHKDSWYSKLFWQMAIPIAVTVIAAMIVWRFGFD